jgi:hypothetical protein
MRDLERTFVAATQALLCGWVVIGWKGVRIECTLRQRLER